MSNRPWLVEIAEACQGDGLELVSFSIREFELVPLEQASPTALADFQTRNRERFAPYAPLRTDAFYSVSHWKIARRASARDRRNDIAMRWVLTDDVHVYAQINMDQIQRGAFQSAVLGYSLDETLEGQGYMTDCLKAVVNCAFTTMRLHRLMANHVPENERSAAVLHRLGFEREGLARSYLRLNGVWRDHVLNSLINPAHLAQDTSQG